MQEYLVQYFKAGVVSELLEAEDCSFRLQAESLEDALQKATTTLWDLERNIGADVFIAYAHLRANTSWHEIVEHCEASYKRAVERMLDDRSKV